MSRTRPVRVKGGWEENVFSPIPVEILSGTDFAYGPTGTKYLSGVTSRHKLAWLWGVVHEATERDGSLVYHAALEMIETQGQFLDAQTGEKEWPAILRGYRWQRGIVLPGERKGDGQMTMAHWAMAHWAMPGEKERKMSVGGEGSVSVKDFVLTAHDSLSCGGESPPPWHMLEIVAAELDALASAEAQVSAEQAGLEPAR